MNKPGRTVLIVVVAVTAIAIMLLLRPVLSKAFSSKRANPDAPSEPDPKSEVPIKNVKASGNSITVTSEDGRSNYVIRVKESQIQITDAGLEYGDLKDVSGEFNQDGKLESTYKSAAARIDRQKQTLTLSGGAVITGETAGVVMKATTVKYDQAKGRIEAEGNVTVTSGGTVLEHLPKLWASPDLKKIATPGKFK